MSEDLRTRVVSVLKTVHDPEIPVNIYELGLIYDVQISQDADVVVTMTLTAPNCPVADVMPNQVRQKVQGVDGVKSAKVDLVFDPPWDRSKMSDAAKLTLGFDLDLGRDVVPLSKIR
jgi:FeS assembly SUF system protein